MKTSSLVCCLFVVGLNLVSLCLAQEVGREVEITLFRNNQPHTFRLIEISGKDKDEASSWQASNSSGKNFFIKEGGVGFAECVKYIKDFEPDVSAKGPMGQRNSPELFSDNGFFQVSVQWGKAQTQTLTVFTEKSKKDLERMRKLVEILRSICGAESLPSVFFEGRKE